MARAAPIGRCLAAPHAQALDRCACRDGWPLLMPSLGVDADEDIFVEASRVARSEVLTRRPPEPIRHGGGPAKSSRGTAPKAASILGSLTPALRVIAAA